MIVDIVTVWAPRPGKTNKWRKDYPALLRIQQRTVERLRNHRHVIYGDAKLPGFSIKQVTLQESLMHAILEGQIAYLKDWSDKHPVVLVDMDCVICKSLEPIFSRDDYDAILVRRDGNPTAPIQNGAMYFQAGTKDRAIALFERALELCGRHWGGDQEAMAQAVAPVPTEFKVEERFGMRIYFAPQRPYNHSPKSVAPDKDYIEHFKGDTKQLMADYCRKVLGMVL